MSVPSGAFAGDAMKRNNEICDAHCKKTNPVKWKFCRDWVLIDMRVDNPRFVPRTCPFWLEQVMDAESRSM